MATNSEEARDAVSLAPEEVVNAQRVEQQIAAPGQHAQDDPAGCNAFQRFNGAGHFLPIEAKEQYHGQRAKDERKIQNFFGARLHRSSL